jgi:hypothetical protein
MIARRAIPLTLLVAVAASLVVMVLGHLGAAVVLTGTAVIGSINTICLEGVLVRILQPGRPRFTRGAAALLIVHVAVWALFFAVLYRWRHDIELWAVAVGIGCFLIGLSGAGAKSEKLTSREE